MASRRSLPLAEVLLFLALHGAAIMIAQVYEVVASAAAQTADPQAEDVPGELASITGLPEASASSLPEPQALNDSATVAVSETITIPVTANDIGLGYIRSVGLIAPCCGGSASISFEDQASIIYTAPPKHGRYVKQ
jgi:hypothetical protein